MSAANHTRTSSEDTSEYVLVHDVNRRKKAGSEGANDPGRAKRDKPATTTATKRREPEGRTTTPPFRLTETYERIVPPSLLRPVRRPAVTFEDPLSTATTSVAATAAGPADAAAPNEAKQPPKDAAGADDDDDDVADLVVVEKRTISVEWPTSWTNELDGIQQHEELAFRKNWF